MNVFTNPGEFVFALTYGEAEWVRNVVAAGGCEITSRRRTVELRDPELYRDPDRKGIPIPARWMLGALRVDEFLRMKETHNPAPS